MQGGRRCAGQPCRTGSQRGSSFSWAGSQASRSASLAEGQTPPGALRSIVSRSIGWAECGGMGKGAWHVFSHFDATLRSGIGVDVAFLETKVAALPRDRNSRRRAISHHDGDGTGLRVCLRIYLRLQVGIGLQPTRLHEPEDQQPFFPLRAHASASEEKAIRPRACRAALRAAPRMRASSIGSRNGGRRGARRSRRARLP